MFKIIIFASSATLTGLTVTAAGLTVTRTGLKCDAYRIEMHESVTPTGKT